VTLSWQLVAASSWLRPGWLAGTGAGLEAARLLLHQSLRLMQGCCRCHLLHSGAAALLPAAAARLHLLGLQRTALLQQVTVLVLVVPRSPPPPLLLPLWWWTAMGGVQGMQQLQQQAALPMTWMQACWCLLWLLVVLQWPA
jgi:hypothetical protein